MSATPDSTLANPQQLIADLGRQLDKYKAERDEALAQQTATAEVLQVINASPGDLTPVFDAILERALRVSESALGFIATYDGEHFHMATGRGLPPAFAEMLLVPYRPPPGAPTQRLIDGESFVQIADLLEDEGTPRGLSPVHRALVEAAGGRSFLAVPLRREGVLVGVIVIYRQEVRPFSEKQIALLQNFGAQAVIAMENARLLTETREALEQQTATAEVLQVINSSPGDLAPVFDVILEKAHDLCGATYRAIGTFDSDYYFRSVATRGYPEPLTEKLRQGFAGLTNPVTRPLLDGGAFVHVPDLGEIDHPIPQAAAKLGGFDTGLFIPLRKDDAVLGMFSVARTEVRLFTDKQIALLQNFAAQAVIAMENARLLTETREALEQQTATAEVLQVINSSPGDLAPVFDAMLEKATRLCEAPFGNLRLWDGDSFHVGAVHGEPSFSAWAHQRGSFRPGRDNSPLARIVGGEQVVHLVDATNDEGYKISSGFRQMVDASGIRSSVTVGLRKEDALLGTITVYRQEVRPFTDKQIALLQNFAAQAVIAMENARLLTETREALEQQTATAEVLQVINSSPGDLAPVFDAMLEKATRLCDAAFGLLWTYGVDGAVSVAHRGVPVPYAKFLADNPLGTGSGTGRARVLQGEPFVHTADVADDEPYRTGDPLRRALVDLGGVRTSLVMPLRKDEAVVGFINVFRQEVRSFSDKQIALLQNFAAQAVIAMENARLLTETREALEQQTATAEVLQVINSSPGDLAPVFDAMLESALHLCEAQFGNIATYDGESFDFAALAGHPEFSEWARRNGPGAPRPGTTMERALCGENVIHIPDMADDEGYRSGTPVRRALVEIGGFRTLLCVALRKDDRLLGMFHIYRQEVRPFADKQIALLQNFAAQAVIAMENARLIDEIRQRQAELRVTFDNMGDGVVMFDEELRLTAWNRNFQELLDLPDEFLAGRPAFAEYFRYLAARGEYPADLEAELSRGLTETGEDLRLERTRPDGRVIEVRRNAVPGGGFVLIYGDITERKQAEARLRAARDTAEGALRELRAAQANLIHAEKMASLGQLTAGIAHEIKNPLNFVNNFAGLSVELLDELKEAAAPAVASLGDDERAEIDDLVSTLSGNLDKIAEHGRRADGIVSSMLLHSRGGSGERREVDLNALVEEALNLAYHGARARDQSFEIVLERDFDRDARPIELVPQDMTRVLLNLIGNGFYAASTKRRAAQNGAPAVLKVTTRDLGEMVEIRVRDNGAGIPPEIRDKLFQPFFTTKPTGEGTGLGLSISWDIVTQQHRGTIAVDSRVGEFTEFTVRLPRTAAKATQA